MWLAGAGVHLCVHGIHLYNKKLQKNATTSVILNLLAQLAYDFCPLM